MSGNLFGIVIGAALAYTGGHTLVVSLRRRRGMVRATGTVLGLEKAPSMSPGPLLPSGSDGLKVSGFGPDYKPLIEFTTPDGDVVRFQSKLQLNGGAMALMGGRYRPGRQVMVRYRPEDPQQALLQSPLTWGIAALLLAAGLVVLAVSALSG